MRDRSYNLKYIFFHRRNEMYDLTSKRLHKYNLDLKSLQYSDIWLLLYLLVMVMLDLFCP